VYHGSGEDPDRKIFSFGENLQTSLKSETQDPTSSHQADYGVKSSDLGKPHHRPAIKLKISEAAATNG
jgi:hypothetical protein